MGTFAGPDEVLMPGFVFACDIQLFRLDEEIGIRIEDTVAVTENGCERLSLGVPRTVAEIEALMKEDGILQTLRKKPPSEERTDMRRTLTVISVVILSLVQALPGQTVDYAKKPLQSERSRSFDALHYLVKIALDLERKSFAGTATVTASSSLEGLEACVLDAEEFAVSSVIDEYGAPLRFEQSDKELKVFLARPAKFGEIVTFTCRYDGRDPRQGLRFVDETPDNPRLVWSDSWPDNVHHWFPCFDYPNDKATTEIVATVRAGLKVASNGRLVGVFEDPTAGTVTYHWSQELPHSTYLVFLAAAPYVVVRDAYKNLPVNYWVYPQDVTKPVRHTGKRRG